MVIFFPSCSFIMYPLSYVPLILSNCRMVKDPVCADEEEKCKRAKVAAAARVLVAQKNIDASKAKLQEAREDANVVG